MTHDSSYTSIDFDQDNCLTEAIENIKRGVARIRDQLVMPALINSKILGVCQVLKYEHLELPWRWYCRKCECEGKYTTWHRAYRAADRHARNHYKGWPQ